jgi:hypothetical protein
MFQNTCDNVSEHYRNVPEHYWKYCEILLKYFRTLLKMLRNTFENVPELYELFRNTFENISEHFLKTVLMFRNNIPKHLWQCSGAHFWKCSGTIWNVPEHFLKCFGILLKCFRNTFEKETLLRTVLMFWNNIEMFRNSFENTAEQFLKCFGTFLKLFLNAFEMFRNTFWKTAALWKQIYL